MSLRKVLVIIGAVLLLGLSFFIFSTLKSSKSPRGKRSSGIDTTTVFIQDVKNGTIPIIVDATGVLTATNRIELYAEVQGILKPATKPLRAGSMFKKNQVIVRIDEDEADANFKARKSDFLSLIVSTLPDIKLDYPASYDRWAEYARQMDVQSIGIATLPEIMSEKERLFIAARGLISSYYNLKNLSITLKNYQIRAPFDGMVTEALVREGTLVRPSQKLGEFKGQSQYVMLASVGASYLSLMKVNSPVQVISPESGSAYAGKVKRINRRIDRTTQTFDVYIAVDNRDLSDGMFMNANIKARDVEEAFEVDRALLVDQTKLYIVRDSKLMLKEVSVAFFKKQTAIVQGLEDGDQVVANVLSTAFEGMAVKTVYKTSKALLQ